MVEQPRRSMDGVIRTRTTSAFSEQAELELSDGSGLSAKPKRGFFHRKEKVKEVSVEHKKVQPIMTRSAYAERPAPRPQTPMRSAQSLKPNYQRPVQAKPRISQPVADMKPQTERTRKPKRIWGILKVVLALLIIVAAVVAVWFVYINYYS
ncbi:MAG: hypothetical protein ACHQUB_03625 [Candidatus Saccharimonadia bacterium]